MKETLTDKGLAALAPADEGKRYVVWDALQQNFGVRVTDKGRLTFVAVRRQAGAGKLVWTRLGTYPAMKLKTARRLARDAVDALEAGQNPTETRRAQEHEQARRAADTVGGAVEDFLADREVAELRTARFLSAILRREFLGQRLERRVGDDAKSAQAWASAGEPIWRNRPVTSINRRDVIERIEAINRRRQKRSGGKYAAHHAFSACRRFFSWAIERGTYGLETSPCTDINIKRLVGAKGRRDRVLSNAEIRLVWEIADELPQPFGPLLHVLLLTGQRLGEIANAKWTEIDLGARLLTVPSARMKMKEAHTVPLTGSVMDLLEKLPRFDRAVAFVFTTTAGKRPVSGFSKWKERLDEKIAAAAAPVGMPHFTLQDLRRTVRTRLAELKVLPVVAELVIGHKQQGIHAVYDVHTYDAEKRDALERWERALLAIVENRTPEVTDLESARVRRLRAQ